MIIDTKDTPSVYVGTYSKYNNGSIAGAWLSLDDYTSEAEFLAACREVHKDELDPELMFQDYEGFPKRYYSESGLDGELWDYLKHIEEHDKDIVDALIENGMSYDTEYIIIPIDRGMTANEAIGYHFYENGCLDIPEHLLNYFDFDSYGRDVNIMGNYIELSDLGVVVEILD